MTAATMAFRVGSGVEIQNKKNWSELAKAIWKTAATAAFAELLPKANTLHRTKVFQWLRAANHMLQIRTGKGFDSWRTKPAATSPATWPSLTLVADHCGDGQSAIYYLISRYINVVPLWDQSHRMWDDAQLALHEADSYFYAIASVIVLNAGGGAFNSERWRC